jgi:maleylacetate reductase
MQGDYFFLPLEHVIFGAGSLERLPGELERLKVLRALIITGQSLATKTGIVRKVEETLGAAHAGTFSVIRQHTPESDVARAVEEARRVQTDILISLGGGSPIDATKAVARALAQSGGQYLPHLAIPTTLSAAEFSHLAGVTNESGGQPIKAGFVDVAVTPRVVLLDPTLTLETPLPLWLSTGIRALDHAVETLYAPGAHPVNDVLALEAIKNLFAALPACQSDPANLDTRLELQLAAWFSFFDEFNTRMGLSHDIGRRLGATYNIPHGITSCIALAPVMRLLAPVHTQALARIAGILNLPEARSGDDLDAARAAAGAVAGLISRLGLPNRLGSFGLDRPALVKAVESVGATPEQAEYLVGEML